MRITVTEGHIRKGVAKGCSHCPLALAISEAIGAPAQVGVGLWWKNWPGSKMKELPARAEKFRRAFDQGRPVQPFSFDLPLEVEESAAHPQVDESH